MNKVMKSFVMLLVLGSIGVGGYYLGFNSAQLSGAGIVSDEEDAEIIKNIDEFKNVIERDYLFDYEEEDLDAGIYKGLFAGLNDPYSVYYTGEEFQKLMEDTAGEFAGIGVVVTAGEDGFITVVSPIEGTPGAKAGIRAGDKIIMVNGESYFGVDLEQATNEMRGEEGTEVTVTIQRLENEKQITKDITIKREMIHVDSVNSQMLDQQIGYLNITSFDEQTDIEFETHFQSLKDAGAKGIVLDLRNNPGGLLDTTERIADMLLGESVIVTTVDKNGNEEKATSDKNQETMPMIVLVNEGSASASEILLGALRDNQRAKSVGETTFGKGIVQRIYPLSADMAEGGFKLTMAEYLTPSGDRIHEKGITPDFVVELPEDIEGIGPEYKDKDTQLKKAIEELSKEIK